MHVQLAIFLLLSLLLLLVLLVLLVLLNGSRALGRTRSLCLLPLYLRLLVCLLLLRLLLLLLLLLLLPLPPKKRGATNVRRRPRRQQHNARRCWGSNTGAWAAFLQPVLLGVPLVLLVLRVPLLLLPSSHVPRCIPPDALSWHPQRRPADYPVSDANTKEVKKGRNQLH